MTNEMNVASTIAAILHKNRPHLPYHNWEHVKNVVGILTDFVLSFEEDEALQLAAIFHDVVYEVGQIDNERNSTLVMQSVARGAGLSQKVMVEAAFMINMTQVQYHLGFTLDDIRVSAVGWPRVEIESLVLRIAQLLSADLASLASPWEEFVQHQENIIREHIGISAEIQPEHRKKSAEFLIKFLDKPSIYLDPAMALAFEEKARSNINRWKNENS